MPHPTLKGLQLRDNRLLARQTMEGLSTPIREDNLAGGGVIVRLFWELLTNATLRRQKALWRLARGAADTGPFLIDRVDSIDFASNH